MPGKYRRKTLQQLGLAVLAMGVLLGNDLPEPGQPSAATIAANAARAQALPLADTSDLADADRGLLAQIDGDIRNPDGSTAWSAALAKSLTGAAPASVNPSLWRQSQLTAKHGLFEVVPGLYQLRGYDISVMTIIRGERGWIIVDPLTTPAPAKAGLALVNKVLGARPVSAVIFTHSHGDHFGGVTGVIERADVAAGKVPVIAPHNFLTESIGENVLAGTAMNRRVQFQFGTELPIGATGQVGVGLGPPLSRGNVGLIAPTRQLSLDGETLTLDGIVFEFMDAGATEAPSEFVFYLPQFKALHTAEVVTRNFHNVLTPRGALVRDTLKWSRVIDAMLTRYGSKSEVMLASHHWPSWGQGDVAAKLRNQRDLYRYIHDQTLRLANQGLTMHEIAEAIGEPDFAKSDFGTRGYYGTFNHNSKAVYQRYYGWWDGVPANYHQLPAEAAAKNYVAAFGGRDAALAKGREALAAGDYRWAAMLLNHLVFADGNDRDARAALALAYEQLGFQAESGAWRNIYLVAAQELRRDATVAGPISTTNSALVNSIPAIDLFDALSARFNPAKMTGSEATIAFVFTDSGEAVTVDLRRSVMFPRSGNDPNATARIIISRADFGRLLAQQVDPQELLASGALQFEGNALAALPLFAALDPVDPAFAVVTP